MKLIFGYCMVFLIFFCALINFVRMGRMAIKTYGLKNKKNKYIRGQKQRKINQEQWVKDVDAAKQEALEILKEWDNTK